MRNSISMTVTAISLVYLLSGASSLSAQVKDADEIVAPVSREIEERMTHERTRITFTRELTGEVELHRTIFQPGTKLSFARFGDLAFALIDESQTFFGESPSDGKIRFTLDGTYYEE